MASAIVGSDYRDGRLASAARLAFEAYLEGMSMDHAVAKVSSETGISSDAIAAELSARMQELASAYAKGLADSAIGIAAASFARLMREILESDLLDAAMKQMRESLSSDDERIRQRAAEAIVGIVSRTAMKAGDRRRSNQPSGDVEIAGVAELMSE